jgi:hypothetical protein
LDRAFSALSTITMSSRLIQLGLLSFISSAIAIPVFPSGGYSYDDAAFSGPRGTGGVAFGTGRHHHPHGTGHLKPSKTGDLTMEALSTPAAASPTGVDTAVQVDAVEGADSTSCSTTIYYTTTTDIQTVYVTPSDAAAASVDSTIYASSIAPIATSSSSTPVAPVAVPSYSAPAAAAPVASSSSSPAAANKFTYSAPAAVAPTSSFAPVAVPAVSSAAPVIQAAPAASTKAASTTAASSGSTVGGKRGIAYGTPAQAQPLIGKTQWAYNWGSNPGGLASGVEYLPMLWGNTADKTNSWVSDATKAIGNGATAVLGFNEPDHPQQANLSPQVAATAYQQYITNNFAGKTKLISPAVTNGGGSMGLTWLSTFMGLCSACKIDAVAIHWYDVSTNTDYFKSHIQDAHTQSGLPVYLTEFGTTDGNDQAFLEAVLPWLDSQDYVQNYAYFMAEDGKLLSGSELSAAGNTYCA